MAEHDERTAAFEKIQSFSRSVAELTVGFRTIFAGIVDHSAFRQFAGIAASFPTWLSKLAQTVTAAQAGIDRTLRGAKSLGAMGWTLPYNASLQDWQSLVIAATDIGAADAAFGAYYDQYDGTARRSLIQDLLSRDDLADWRPLMEEVAVNVEAGRFRVSVPALLAVFEGIAHRWTPDFWTRQTRDGRRGRDPFFRAKLSGLAADSFEFFEWSAMEAFVSALYSQAGERKPLMLNRHWILHGRGLPDANSTDCLRILQAIHTALELARDELDGLVPLEAPASPSGGERAS